MTARRAYRDEATLEPMRPQPVSDLPLWATPIREMARRTDGPTSKAAAIAIADTLNALQERVYRAYQAYGPMTARGLREPAGVCGPGAEYGPQKNLGVASAGLVAGHGQGGGRVQRLRGGEVTRQLNAMHTGPRREDWETPPDLFAKYDAEFGFTLDAAANASNAKCPDYLSENALAMRWPGVVWLNPPYGKAIGSWVQKAHQEAHKGSTVVCLVPARTDSWWWHDYTPMAEIRFIRGRIKFVGAPYNAPFPSAILIFRPPYTCVLFRGVA